MCRSHFGSSQELVRWLRRRRVRRSGPDAALLVTASPCPSPSAGRTAGIAAAAGRGHDGAHRRRERRQARPGCGGLPHPARPP